MGVSRRCAAAPDGRVSAEWSRCPGSMARRPRVVWLFSDEAQHIGCLRGLEGCPLV